MLGALVFTLGQVPTAVSGVYQEACFRAKSGPANVFQMTAWATLAQFLVLLLAVVTLSAADVFLPTSSSSSSSSAASGGDYWWGRAAPDQFRVGWLCATGSPLLEEESPCRSRRSEEEEQQGEGAHSEPPDTFSGLSAAGWMMPACALSMFATTLLQSLLVRLSSAALTVITVTAVLPTSAVLFASPWLMGSAAEPLGPPLLLSLCVVVLGVVLFRVGDDRLELLRRLGRGGLLRPTPAGAASPEVGATSHAPSEVTPLTAHRVATTAAAFKQPTIIGGRMGAVTSEYTQPKGQDGVAGLFLEFTRRHATGRRGRRWQQHRTGITIVDVEKRGTEMAASDIETQRLRPQPRSQPR